VHGLWGTPDAKALAGHQAGPVKRNGQSAGD